MILPLNINIPTKYQLGKLFKEKQKSTFTRFNYKLFKLNENFREKSAKIGFKNILPQKKTGNIYLDNMMIIENCSKEKNKKNNKRLTLSLKRYKEVNKNNNYQTEFNLALVPLRDKINRHKYFTSLISENSKSDKNYFETKSRENLKKNLNINASNSNFNFRKQIANNYVKKVDDTYSDCHSLKGVMIDIKKKIKENKFNVNRIFGEFDKQIVQEQYLIERFYEMKKNLINKNKLNKLKKNIKNKKILSNFDKIIKNPPKNFNQ